MINRKDSDKRKALIEAYVNSLSVGERVNVKDRYLSESGYRPDDETECEVKNIGPDGFVTVEFDKYLNSKPLLKLVARENIIKSTYAIGAYPFPVKPNKLKNINFTLESIIYDICPREGNEKRYEIVKGVRVEETNWNPYVIINGEKKYYQRPFVWTLQEKQSLIDSIYNEVGCGKIVIVNRPWEKVEALVLAGHTEVSFKDIVDGKQRLNAVIGFTENEFPDSYGNYWSDLSAKARNKFGENQLFSYCYLEDPTPEDVLEQFLKVNFAGIPQSIEHIEFVKSLHKKLIN